MKRALLVLVLFLFCIVSADTFSVQGVLRDPLGKTVEDGYYSLNFKLYNLESGGSALWEETHEMVLIGNGVYLVELGSVTSLDAVAFNENYWIGIGVNGGNEMEPRIKMTKSPAAMSVFGVDNVFPSTGQVGVGTHEPEAYLHIIDSTSGMDKLRIEGEDGANDVVVSAEGKMGVNVEEPEADLHIKSLESTGNKLLITDPDDSTRVVITADGRMGINTEEPQEALDIIGNMKMRNGSILFSDGSALNSANFGGAASSISNYGTAFINGDSDNDGIGGVEIRSGETTVLEITADDRINVNAEYLGINNDEIMMQSDEIEINANKIIIGETTQSTDGDVELVNKALYVNTTFDNYWQTLDNPIAVGSEVGIFCSQAIASNGGIHLSNKFHDESEYLKFYYVEEVGDEYWVLSHWSFGIDSSLDAFTFSHYQHHMFAYIDHNGNFVDCYNENLRNTEPLTGTLEKIKEINPISFNVEGQDDQSIRRIGFSEEEVESLFPELVYESPEDNSIGINTSGYGIVAISAVKELNEKVEEQEQKIEELEKALAALMQEVKNLKN